MYLANQARQKLPGCTSSCWEYGSMLTHNSSVSTAHGSCAASYWSNSAWRGITEVTIISLKWCWQPICLSAFTWWWCHSLCRPQLRWNVSKSCCGWGRASALRARWRHVKQVPQPQESMCWRRRVASAKGARIAELKAPRDVGRGCPTPQPTRESGGASWAPWAGSRQRMLPVERKI